MRPRTAPPLPASVRALLLALALAAALGACRGAAPPVTFYALQPMAPVQTPAPDARELAVGVGPLEIPHGIDRPHIMTRDAKGRLHLSELHRWGGALEADVLRVLTSNLGGLLGSQAVVAYPWTSFIDPDYRVPVTIHRLDGQLGDEVLLDATWGVAPRGARQAAEVRRSVVRVPVDGPGYDALVAAHGEALAALSHDIAAAVEAMRAAGR